MNVFKIKYAIILSLYFSIPCNSQPLNLTSSVLGEIMLGENALPDEFPWYVGIGSTSLLSKSSIFCGGTLIEKNFVLTAGHCVDDGKDYVVYTGIHDLGKFADWSYIKVKKVIFQTI